MKLVGVAEPNPALRAEAEKAGVDKSLLTDEDYTQMLDSTKPDIVWAFVENNRHLEIVKVCAPRKINVIFEKPLASTGADAREVQETREAVRHPHPDQLPDGVVAGELRRQEGRGNGIGTGVPAARHRGTWRSRDRPARAASTSSPG